MVQIAFALESGLNKTATIDYYIPPLRSNPKLRGAEHSMGRSYSGDLGMRAPAPLWTGVDRANRPYYFLTACDYIAGFEIENVSSAQKIELLSVLDIS